ncbi:MAG: methyltransferase domain-containing protein [Planctomycetota bacterium]|jgi:trans-aconitate methyltransferase
MIASRGCVYTPAPLADRLASIALHGLAASEPPRVCDPACGDGALLDAVRDIRGDARLYGVDLDAAALVSARARLGSAASLERGDALARDWADAPFDVVVANPPWVSFSGRHAAALSAQRRAELRQRFTLFRSWPSLHAAFVELAVRLASARVALLLPAQVCDLERYGPVRAHLRAHGTLRTPALALGEDAFDGVVQPSCIVLLERGSPEQCADDAPIPLDHEAAGYPDMLDRLPKPPPRLFGDIGVHTGNSARRLIGSTGAPVREGRDVTAYRLAAARRRFVDDAQPAPGEYFRAQPLERYREIPIVLRQTADRPIAALHHDPTYFRNSVLACRGLPGVPDELLVAWLNHPLVTAYHQTKVREAGQRAFPQVKVRHLRDLPLPDLARAPHDTARLARLVAREGRMDLAEELDAALARFVLR